MGQLQTFVSSFGFDFDAVRGILIFSLLFSRMLPIVSMSPFLGGQFIQSRLKTMVSMVLTFVLLPYFYTTAGEIPHDYSIIFYLLKEAFIGFVIGFYISLIYYAIQGAGFIIDQSRGQTQGQNYDPFLSAQVSFTGEYLNLLSIVLFFGINGHLIFINEICNSYFIIPLNQFPHFTSYHLIMIMEFSARFFIIAVRLSVPILIVILSADILMGIVNKMAQSVNVFFLSMPLKAFLGILILLIALPVYFQEIKTILMDMIDHIKYFLGYLNVS